MKMLMEFNFFAETGGDDEGVSESPKKDRKSWRGADVETVKERNDQVRTVPFYQVSSVLSCFF